jgi:hypothetical protein
MILRMDTKNEKVLPPQSDHNRNIIPQQNIQVYTLSLATRLEY